jgi:hypothetical protein
MGRFMSPDWSAKVAPVPYAKLDNPQSLNLYAYVGNNPLIRIDADGHYSCTDKAACQGTKDSLAIIREAVNSGNLTKKEAAALNKVLAFYGPLQKAGHDNGVTVSSMKPNANDAGGTVTSGGRTTITIDFKGTLSDPHSSQNGASPDTELAAQVAHEGEHGVQDQASGGSTNIRSQIKADEVDAYKVQSYVNKGEMDNSSYWSKSAGAAIWSNGTGYSAAAVNDYANQSTRDDCASGGCR